jgi:hypothetical protein
VGLLLCCAMQCCAAASLLPHPPPNPTPTFASAGTTRTLTLTPQQRPLSRLALTQGLRLLCRRRMGPLFDGART